MKVYNENFDGTMNKELHEILSKIRQKRHFNAENYVRQKAKLLNAYMKQSHLSGCVLGVSGGVDSATVLGIIKFASEQPDSPIKKIIPLLLPVYNSVGATNQDKATSRGEEVCKKFGLKPHIVNLEKVNLEIRNSLESVVDITGESWAIGQLCSYSRTPVVYYTTSLLNQAGYPALVCGTINKDEGAYLGYVGKASDGMVDVQMIADIHKSEVYKTAQFLGVPQSIMEVKPTGDMYDGRTDEVVFGASYDFVELYLSFLEMDEKEQTVLLQSLSKEAKEHFDRYAKNLENLHRYNAHKYISGSQAVHLDIFETNVKNGWVSSCEMAKRFLNA